MTVEDGVPLKINVRLRASSAAPLRAVKVYEVLPVRLIPLTPVTACSIKFQLPFVV